MTEAYVTLATNDQYALGALVLAHSLRSVKTTKQLCILITPDVKAEVRDQLNSLYDQVVIVDVLDSNDTAHLALMSRPELGITLTKLHCWSLIQFKKCVFLDADILAIQNADELFEQGELSAACDVGWPDCFNSGMFVFVPSMDTYSRLLKHAQDCGSFDGGDQGLLNAFFPNWNRVSFVYNMVSSVTYTYLPAYKQFGADVKFVHFLGATKPWQQKFHKPSGTVATQPGQEFISGHLNAWWHICTTLVQPEISPEVLPNMEGVISPIHKSEQTQEIQAQSSHNTYTDHDFDDRDTDQVKTCPLHDSPTQTPTALKVQPPILVDTPAQPDTNSIPLHSHDVDSADQLSPSPSQQYIDYSEPFQAPPPSPPPQDNSISDNPTRRETVELNQHQRIKSNPTPIDPTMFRPFMSTRISSPFSLAGILTPVLNQELSEQMLGMSLAECNVAESRQRWETGIPDYLGKDSFSNILQYINSKLSTE